MKKMYALLTLACCLLSFNGVKAEQWEGFYVKGFGGANFVSTRKRNHERLDFNTGYVIAGALGYRLCNGLRFEGEISYYYNTIDKIRRGNGSGSGSGSFVDSTGSGSGSGSFVEFSGGSGSGSGRGRGHLRDISYMANLIYDLDLSCWDCCWSCWEIVPYFGGGIGYSNSRLKRSRHNQCPDGFTSGSEFDSGSFVSDSGDGSGSGSGSDTGRRHRKDRNGFAWQIIAGLAYEFSPCADVSIEYRFHKGSENKIYNNAIGLAAKYHF